MPFLVTGTRERIHPARTSEDAVGEVADEIEPMGPGWVALTSERRPDGSLRVIYGRLPDEAGHTDVETRAVAAGGQMQAREVRSVTSLVVLCAIVLTALAAFTLLAR
jgi:hypothetical protein